MRKSYQIILLFSIVILGSCSKSIQSDAVNIIDYGPEPDYYQLQDSVYVTSDELIIWK